jgi:hypothetical protein
MELREMKGMMERSISGMRKMLGKPSGRQGILIVVMLCIGCLVAASVAPAPVRGSNDNTSGVAPIAPLKAQLTATVIVPTQIGFCQNFNFHVTVINYGNASARNVHLFFQQNPGGFFTLANVDQMSTQVNQYTEDVALGDLKANSQSDINFVMSVPLQTYLNADWLRRFYFNFTSSYDYVPEELLGRIMFLAGHGKIQVRTTGFSQK